MPTTAEQNKEILNNILETLETLTDLMKDIHLNNIKIYQYVKEQQEIKTEPIKGSWFY